MFQRPARHDLDDPDPEDRSGRLETPARSVVRLEPVLVAFFLATWVVALLALVGLVDLAGSLELGLYPLYSTAAASGWIAGNLYVARSGGVARRLRRRILLVYFLGPPGLVYLLRAMATEAVQQSAPLVPLFAFGVFAVLFLVPVLLPRTPRTPRAHGGR
jgi:hypothetical protein